MARDLKTRIAAAAPVSPSALELERSAVATFGKREFLESLGKLTSEFATDAENPGSYACVGCERCANCMFCKECDGCYQCTHCTRCALCNSCSHCVESKNCHACAYCVQSENCSNSAYVVLSQNLSDCNYCFGCVGLSKKDFHILNVPFGRQEFFKIFNRLKKELGIP